MAIITTIRERMGVIISIVIGLALVVFILESALTSNRNLLGNSDTVGKINGQPINYNTLQAEIQHQEDIYKMNQPNAKMDEALTTQLRDQAWNKLMTDNINHTQYSKLGLMLTEDEPLPKEEVKDLFYGANPNPDVKRQFSDPQTGMFDPNRVSYFVKQLDQDKTGETVKRWDAFSDYVVQSTIDNKYRTLLHQGFYTPKWLAEVDYHDKNDKASIHFVNIPFATIPDNTIKVTDAELTQYIQDHKEKYKQDESRAIDYVIYTVQPSHDDTMAAQDFMTKAYTTYTTGDTDAIRKIADNASDLLYYKKGQLETAKADTLLKQPMGKVYGPYFENGSYKLFKIVDKRNMPDSVKAAHILIRPAKPGDSTKAKRKADSIFTLVKSGKVSFDTLAAKFSEDPGSKAKGGVLGWVREGQTVKAFNDFLYFSGAKKGDVKVVKTEYGYHVIKMLQDTNISPAVKVSYTTRKLDPSSVTDKATFNAANAFVAAHKTDSSFIKAAREMKLSLLNAETVKPNDNSVPGLSQAKDLVRWMYGASKGDVSDVIPLGNKYVVAILKRVNAEGTKSIEDPTTRAQVTAEVIKEKKATAIMAKYFSGPLSANLQTYAQASNTQIQEATNITAGSPYLQGLGYEPKAVGAVFASKPGQMLKPIKGENSVYVIYVDDIQRAPAVADYTQNKMQLTQMMGQRADYQLPEAMKKLMHVEDLRYKFQGL